MKEANIAGTWMLAMSLFITVYALVIYYRRVYLMRNGKHYGYIDFIGPGILAASIISGIIMLIVYTHTHQAKSPSATTKAAAVSTMARAVRLQIVGRCSNSGTAAIGSCH